MILFSRNPALAAEETSLREWLAMQLGTTDSTKVARDAWLASGENGLRYVSALRAYHRANVDHDEDVQDVDAISTELCRLASVVEEPSEGPQ